MPTKKRFAYEYARPAVTADCVVFTMVSGDLAVLLIRRAHPPFEGAWALPGGFVDENEPLVHAAARELREETGLVVGALEQIGAFGDPGRDPRGHMVSVAFFTFLLAATPRISAGDDAAEAAWYPLAKLPRLAFDHARIIAEARRRFAGRLVAPLEPFEQADIRIVPPRFTLSELHRVYEAALGRAIDARAWKKSLLARDLVEPVTRGKTRREALYRWKKR
jgi:8-oxo-dGTP diphosphatase